jgi:hypothetical protein
VDCSLFTDHDSLFTIHYLLYFTQGAAVMKTQDATTGGAAGSKRNHHSPINQLTDSSKRSSIMNATRFFSRALMAILSIFLMAAVAMGQNLNLNGAATIGGTVRVKGNIDNTSSTGTNAFTGTVELKGTAAQAIGGSANAINFTTLTTTGVSTKNINTASTIATAITTASGTTTKYVLAAGKKLTLQGTIANGGTAAAPYDFSAAGAEVDYAGGAQSVWTTPYDKLTVSTAGSKSMGGDLTVASALAVATGDFSIGANTLTVNGTYSITSGGTVTGGATSNMTLGGTGSLASFAVTNGLNNFTLNRDTYTVTLGGGLTVAGALALNNGTLAVSTQTLTLQGTVGVAGSGALTSAAAGTVEYTKGSDVQTVLASNYGNLTFSSFAKTLPNGGTVGIAGTFTPGASPNAHTITGSTIEFNGGAQSIPTFNAAGTGYQNLTLSGNTTTKTASGNVVVAGNFDNGGSGTDAVTLAMGLNSLTIAGTKDNSNSTIQFAGATNGRLFTTGTVEYNGTTVTQTVEGHATNKYANLVFSGTQLKLITSAAGLVHTTGSLSSTVDIQVGANAGDTTAELYVDGDLTIGATANVTNNGIITVGN